MVTFFSKTGYVYSDEHTLDDDNLLGINKTNGKGKGTALELNILLHDYEYTYLVNLHISYFIFWNVRLLL